MQVEAAPLSGERLVVRYQYSEVPVELPPVRWEEVRRELLACWRYQLGVARTCAWCGLGEKDIANAGCGRARPR